MDPKITLSLSQKPQTACNTLPKESKCKEATEQTQQSSTSDKAEFSFTLPSQSTLVQQLDSMPDIRADKVARAKELVARDDYPSSADLDKLASKLLSPIGSDEQDDTIDNKR